MKKLLLFFALAAVAMTTGCGKEQGGNALRINYIYLNRCSSEITVHSFSPNPFGGVRDSLFTIPQGKSHTIAFIGGGEGGMTIEPLQWNQSLFSGLDYVTISNGKKIVTQTLANNDELYLYDSYIPIIEDTHDKTVLYVFTDDFLKNGEPIE